MFETADPLDNPLTLRLKALRVHIALGKAY